MGKGACRVALKGHIASCLIAKSSVQRAVATRLPNQQVATDNGLMKVGLVGIGHMGLPMARRLLATGLPLTVWNRTPARCEALRAAGAQVAASLEQLYADCTVVLLMLRGEAAINAALGRYGDAMRARVAGRCILQMGTLAPEVSVLLERDVRAHGGQYVEAPVSGSTTPAESGALVGMIAGDSDAIRTAMPVLQRLCREVYACGPVPQALRTKLAVNHYLIAMVVALSEAAFAAQRAGVDLSLLRQIIDDGPMSSAVSRTKLAKIVDGDYSAQAAIADVAEIARLVVEQTRHASAHAPLIAASAHLYRLADALGGADLDMCALQPALELFEANPDVKPD